MASSKPEARTGISPEMLGTLFWKHETTNRGKKEREDSNI
jgi:hypothetical protein